MKVRELIAELQEIDGNLDVVTISTCACCTATTDLDSKGVGVTSRALEGGHYGHLVEKDGPRLFIGCVTWLDRLEGREE